MNPKKFLDKVYQINPHLQPLEIIEYEGKARLSITCRDKYGVFYLKKAENLFLKRPQNTHFLKSAVSKDSYVEGLIKLINPCIYSQISNISFKNRRVYYTTKYGECKSNLDYILKTSKINLKSYISLEEYHKNKLKEDYPGHFSYNDFEYISKPLLKFKLYCNVCEQSHNYCNTSLLRNKGCFKCQGERSNFRHLYTAYNLKKYSEKWDREPCGIYLMKLSKEDEEFYKLGISNNIKKRISVIIKHYNVDILKVVDLNRTLCILKENELLSKYRKEDNRYIPNIKFGGFSECMYLSDEILDNLLRDLETCKSCES